MIPSRDRDFFRHTYFFFLLWSHIYFLQEPDLPPSHESLIVGLPYLTVDNEDSSIINHWEWSAIVVVTHQSLACINNVHQPSIIRLINYQIVINTQPFYQKSLISSSDIWLDIDMVTNDPHRWSMLIDRLLMVENDLLLNCRLTMMKDLQLLLV
jgi:hypothetical protein